MQRSFQRNQSTKYFLNVMKGCNVILKVPHIPITNSNLDLMV